MGKRLMLHIVTLLLCMIVFLQPGGLVKGSGLPEDDGPDNLIHNPGFEEESLLPWVTAPANNSQVLIERSTEMPRTGEAALKFTPRPAGSSNVRQQLTLERGREYSFSVWVRLEEVPSKQQFVQMKLDYSSSTDPAYKPGGTSYPQIDRINQAGTQWVRLQGTHTYEGTGEEVTLWLYFETVQPNAVPVYIDDVYVYQQKYGTAVEISGPTALDIPLAGSPALFYSYEATVFNQDGMPMAGDAEPVTWFFRNGPNEGVALDGDGRLAVDSSASPGYLYITASLISNSQVMGEKRIYIGSFPPLAEHVGIEGMAAAGREIEGIYEYASPVNEGISLYRWLWSDSLDGLYEAMAGETAARLTIGEERAYGFIVFEITPVDANGWQGALVRSEPVQVLIQRNEYYVDPAAGSDSNPGTLQLPFQTIERARDEVRLFNREMQDNITVYLREGEYNYAELGRHTLRSVPLASGEGAYAVRTGWTLDERDSGHNGYEVIYKAYPGENPVISGGKIITQWSIHDQARNIYKAYVGVGSDTRQLYVNGQRAVVARSDGPPANLTFDSHTGHTTTDAFMAGWGNKTDIEFVYHSHWVQHRIKVSSITAEGGLADIRLHEPRWTFAINTQTPSIIAASQLKWIENAYELLDSEGEWYLDRTTGYLYYKPRSGEDMDTAVVTMPVVDELLAIRGKSAAAPVQHVRIEGISFQYAGWLRPNAASGHHGNQNNTLREEGNRLPEGAVAVDFARHIALERNTFSRLGSTALYMKGGIQHIRINGNVFYDISGSGMNIGDPALITPSAVRADGRLLSEHIEITNNYIRHIGVEYESAAGISTSFGRNIRIAHNEIRHIPYTGIHMGWHEDGLSENIRVEHNLIYDLLTTSIYDGGAIYSLGTNQGSAEAPAYTVRNNYIRNQLNESGALFPDNQSKWWLAESNVVDLKDSPAWNNVATPTLIHIHSVQSANHRFLNNYATTGKYLNRGTNNVLEAFHIVPDAVWPREALLIMDQAGLEPEYAALRGREARNMLLNAGFETRQENVWRTVEANFVRSSAEHAEGVKSARVAPLQAGGHMRQTLELLAGMTYELAVKVKLEEGAEQSVSLYVEWTDGQAGEATVVAAGTANAHGWTEIAGAFSYAGEAPGAIADVYIQLADTAGSAPYYVDDFQAVEQDNIPLPVLWQEIAAAEQEHNLAVEGEEEGLYLPGSKALFLEGIADALEAAALEPGPKQAYGILRLLNGHRLWFAGQRIILDRGPLNAALLEAEQLLAQSREGEEFGMYLPGSKAELLAAVQEAEAALSRPDATQAQLDMALEQLEEGISLFCSKLIQLNHAYIDGLLEEAAGLLADAVEGNEPGQYAPGSKQALQAVVDEVNALKHPPYGDHTTSMLVDEESWVNGSPAHQEEGVQFQGRGITYTGRTYLDQLFELEAEFNYVSGAWPGFAVRSLYPSATVGGVGAPTAYLLIFKESEWEYQKWVDGTRTDYAVFPNTQVHSGERHRFRFGALNQNGGVRLLMEVDGQPVFDFVDTWEPILVQGYFGVYSTTGPLWLYPVYQLSEDNLIVACGLLQDALDAFQAGRND